MFSPAPSRIRPIQKPSPYKYEDGDLVLPLDWSDDYKMGTLMSDLPVTRGLHCGECGSVPIGILIAFV